jgi:hypothetical protein
MHTSPACAWKDILKRQLGAHAVPEAGDYTAFGAGHCSGPMQLRRPRQG